MGTPPKGWSAEEQDLWRSVAEGTGWPRNGGWSQADLASSGRDAAVGPRVRAEALSHLLLSPPAALPGKVPLVHLHGANIVGTLSLQHATVPLPVSLIGCVFEHPITLDHASFTALDLTGSRLPSMKADAIKLAGDLCLRGVTAGRLRLFGADVGGNVWVNGANLTAAGADYALDCPQMHVGGGFYATDGLRATGGINVWGASIGSSMELDGACLTRQSGFALRGHGLHVGHDLSCADIQMQNGGMVLFAARIGGQLWLNQAELAGSEGEYAITAPMLDVRGGLYALGLRARGGVNLFSAVIGESVSLAETEIIGESRYALRAPGIVVHGDLDCHRARIVGSVDLSRSEVNGRVRLTGTAFDDRKDWLVDLSNAKVKTLSMTALAQQPALMDMHDSTIHAIEDEPDASAGLLELDGLTYEFLRPSHPVRLRLQWLSRSSDAKPQPYEQLALHYRRIGHDQDARTVLLARYRAQRKRLLPVGRVLGLLEELTTGYGYRPMRAFAWFLALVAAVSVTFAAHPPIRVNTAAAAFNPVAYSLDLILPILDLGQERAYRASDSTQLVAWVASLLGWLLATAIIAGITRRLTRS